MINELYGLSKALQNAGISPQTWHKQYLELPKAGDKAPCVRVLLLEDGRFELSRVGNETAKLLRKYGNKHGTFPAMNLAPLYRITDPAQKEQLQAVLQGKQDAPPAEEIRSWCVASNWPKKFLQKYTRCVVDMPANLEQMLSETPDLAIHKLIRAVKPFQDADVFRKRFEEAAFRLLEQRVDMHLALHVLFYLGNEQKAAADDFGTLSVVLDSEELDDDGIPVVSRDFTEELNAALLRAEAAHSGEASEIDAFGKPYAPAEDPTNDPLPSVKLAGGFDATLRTMFKEQKCQTRYGQIGSGSYPLSNAMRTACKGALEWISAAARKEVTWTKLAKNEILFAYPSRLPEVPANLSGSFVAWMQAPPNQEVSFEKAAEGFLSLFHPTKGVLGNAHPDWMRLFVLRKVNKACTKVVYSRVTTPEEVERQSRFWIDGCRNHPPLQIRKLPTPFPIDTAKILNRVWKQNGEGIEGAAHIPLYHGMDLFLDASATPLRDLQALVQNTQNLAVYAGTQLAVAEPDQKWRKRETDPFLTGQTLLLFSLLLLKFDIRKENYMENFPYLYGQLLKISDALHVLYCRVVRNGEVPPQLAGSSYYIAASENPMRTLSQLGLRMAPYIQWARSYRFQTPSNVEKDCEPWRAKWLLGLYEKTMDAMQAVELPTHFQDTDKAQLFIGYLASLPKLKDTDSAAEMKEEQKHDD